MFNRLNIFISGCVGSASFDHTSHPRVPLQFDISTHIANTGQVAVKPIAGFLSLSPIPDLAYSMQHGADVKKQWKDLVLAGEELYKSLSLLTKSSVQVPTYPVSLLGLRGASGQTAMRYLRMLWRHSST